MSKRVAITGNTAVAEAMRQINPHVVAAYPITPQTEIVQQYASFVSDGVVETEMIRVESEHSAMSACVGAAAAGGRVMTATSGPGFALMFEILFVAASLRLPIIMTVVNRAYNAPLNIHCDHSDSISARDCGWIQIYSENAQEAYDNVFQAVKIGEHANVRLPVMVCMDGFLISHSIEAMEMMEDDAVCSFVGEYKSNYPLLDIKRPVTYGPLDLQDYYNEHKRQQVEAMENARPVIIEVAKEFEKISGRKYGFFEKYSLDDAEIGIVILNSAAGAVKDVVDELREKGIKAGCLKPRVFRPFPTEEYKNALKNLKAIAVLDRSESFGAMGGPVFMEIRSALAGLPKVPPIINYIYGLGGRDLGPDHVRQVFDRLQHVTRTGNTDPISQYLTVRE